MSSRHPSLSPAAVAVGAALLALSAGAFAAPVLTAGSSGSIGGIALTTTPSMSSGYVGSYTGGSGGGNDTYGYAFARDNGAYAVSTNADGVATATAKASFGQSLTNSSGAAQHYTMSFHIYHGFMSTDLNDAGGHPLAAGEFLKALYAADITVNGGNVFTTSAMVMRTDAGTSGSKSGIDLNSGDSAADGDLSWSDSYYTIDLGTVADGGSIDVLATLSDETSSNVGSYTFDGGGCCNSYGYGDCPASEPTPAGKGVSSTESVRGGCAPTTRFKGAARAFYGDPIVFGISPTADDGSGLVITVPEPSMFGLAFLALGTAGWVSRRRQRKS